MQSFLLSNPLCYCAARQRSTPVVLPLSLPRDVPVCARVGVARAFLVSCDQDGDILADSPTAAGFTAE